MSPTYFALVGLGWLLLIALTIHHARRSPLGSCGLTVAYSLTFLLIHMGGGLYILPWYDPSWNWYLVSTGVTRESVGKGFILSLVGMCGYYLGIRVYDTVRSKRHLLRNTNLKINLREARREAFTLILCGMCFYVFLRPIAHRIPSGAAIVTAGMALSTVGCSLLSYVWITNPRSDLRMANTVLLIGIPLLGLLLSGFLSYGIAALIIVVAFNAPHLRLRPKHFLSGIAIFWLGLSLFVTYMEIRENLRTHVLYEGDLLDRSTSTIQEIFSGAQLFNPTNNVHLAFIDGRLNQNSFVGRAVDHIDGRNIDFAYGRTIWFAMVAWIPRSLWADKPEFGGSGTLVMDYTGLQLSRTSSFGVGQVLEFYLNFNAIGVFIGFLVLAAALRHIDVTSAQKLKQADLRGFSGWFLVGICMIQPQGALAEIVASSAAGIIIMLCMKKINLKIYNKINAQRSRMAS